MPKTSADRALKSSSKPVSVGLPRVPPVYGLKPRKKYLPWSHAEKRLARSRNYWICTTCPDGRPHSMPVWGFWLEGALYFGTGRSTRKGKNIARNNAVSVHLESGDDAVIMEGKAVEISNEQTLTKLDKLSRRKYKMPILISEESAMYRFSPRVVWAWSEKNFPNDATRWEFRLSD